jgi:molybdenum cofactor synthesis domain-containing protein
MAEMDVSNLIGIEQAMRIIDSAPVAPRRLRVAVEKACGFYLAEDIIADRDSPPFDKSVMDGFAVRWQDVQGAPCELGLVGRVHAGETASSAIRQGQAMAIMTGAPIPAGADAVVPVEMTREGQGGTTVIVPSAVKAGASISRRGCEAKAGAVVLPAGKLLEAAQIAVAASVGASPLVFDRPRVGVLQTGDEIVPPTQVPSGAQIRASNGVMLAALLGRFGCEVVELGIVGDEPELIERAISDGLAKHSLDVLLISGGMSMGERDYVPAILKKLGGDLKITKLRIKPGKPFVFAEMPGGKFIFGLPGNPVSAFVCTRVLVSRLIRRVAGGAPELALRRGELAEGLEANGPRTFFLPAMLRENKLKALKWIGSADIYTLAKAEALIIRPENQPAMAAGAMVEFIEI